MPPPELLCRRPAVTASVAGAGSRGSSNRTQMTPPTAAADDAIRTATLTGWPRPRAAAPTSAPTAPPTDHKAWKADMIGRPYPRSTITAWSFMDTSTAPLARPKINSATPRVRGPVVCTGRLTATTYRARAAPVTTLLPQRAMAYPAICMPITPPAPSTRSSRPRVAWETPVLSCTEGMLTSQAAIPSPTTKKTPKTPNRARRSRVETGAVTAGTDGLTGFLLRSRCR